MAERFYRHLNHTFDRWRPWAAVAGVVYSDPARRNAAYLEVNGHETDPAVECWCATDDPEELTRRADTNPLYEDPDAFRYREAMAARA